jgi:hypothetical protein
MAMSLRIAPELTREGRVLVLAELPGGLVRLLGVLAALRGETRSEVVARLLAVGDAR